MADAVPTFYRALSSPTRGTKHQQADFPDERGLRKRNKYAPVLDISETLLSTLRGDSSRGSFGSSAGHDSGGDIDGEGRQLHRGRVLFPTSSN